MQEPMQIQIQSSGNNEPSIEEHYAEISKNTPWIKKMNAVNAHLKKNLYDEYVKNGFDEEQALFLIR